MKLIVKSILGWAFEKLIRLLFGWAVSHKKMGRVKMATMLFTSAECKK
jgi:hypothetical protein